MEQRQIRLMISNFVFQTMPPDFLLPDPSKPNVMLTLKSPEQDVAFLFTFTRPEAKNDPDREKREEGKFFDMFLVEAKAISAEEYEGLAQAFGYKWGNEEPH